MVTTPSGFPAALEKIYTTAQILLLTPHETLQYLPTHHLFTTYTPKAQAESLDGHLKKKTLLKFSFGQNRDGVPVFSHIPLRDISNQALERVINQAFERHTLHNSTVLPLTCRMVRDVSSSHKTQNASH